MQSVVILNVVAPDRRSEIILMIIEEEGRFEKMRNMKLSYITGVIPKATDIYVFNLMENEAKISMK